MSRVNKLYDLYERVAEGTANFYEVFGLQQDCQDVQIKKAYRKLSIVCHPDNYVSEGEDVQTIAANCSHYVNIMYDTLSDPVKRSHYDLHGTIVEEKDYADAQNAKRHQDRINEIFDVIKDVEYAESFATPITVPLKLVYHGGTHTFTYEDREFKMVIPKGMMNPTMLVLKGELGGEYDVKGNLCVLAMQGSSKDVTVNDLDVEASVPETALKFDGEGMLASVKVLGQWVDVSQAIVSKNKGGTKYKIEGLGMQNCYVEGSGDLVVKVTKPKAKPKKPKNVD